MTSPSADLPPPTPGAKMMFLIRRRQGVSREELIAHWYAHHMPGVIRSQERAADAGKAHAHRYLASVFDPRGDAAADREGDWDGVAQLWWDQPLPRPRAPFGRKPRDSFQERAEPYWPWATVEYVIVDGSDELPVRPLTLNAPFPTTRSGFCKVVYLLAARAETDFQAFYGHWLTVHAQNAAAALAAAGGFRYVVSLSLEASVEPYAGMAEIYFPDRQAWSRFSEALTPDGLEQWIDSSRSRTFTAGTEMIGIP